jgi:hypothetical protein
VTGRKCATIAGRLSRSRDRNRLVPKPAKRRPFPSGGEGWI